MAQTVVNTSQAVQDKDGYAGYTFRLEVIMNSYDATNSTYNITINHYAKGDTATNHKYHGLTTPKSTITATANGSTIVSSEVVVSQITGGEVNVHSWTGNIQADASGNLYVTYSAKYNANKSSGYLPKTNTISQGVQMPTIPRYATITSYTVSQRDETSLNVSWRADVSCDWAQYRIRQSGGSYGSWINCGTDFTISGLSADITYIVQIQVRRADSGLWTSSGEYRQTTYAYPYASNMPNFVIGNTANLTIYNPLSRSCKIYIINTANTEKELGTITGVTIQIPNTQEWQTFLYNGIPDDASGLYKVRLVCDALSRDTTVNGGTYSVNPANNKPDVSTFIANYVADLTNLTNNNQTVINGVSTITYTITRGATALNGASISNYTVTWGSATGEITNIATPTTLVKGSGNTISVTVTDSRGITNTVSTPISEVINYTTPTSLSISPNRQDGVGQVVYLDAEGIIYYDKFGTNGVSNRITNIKYSITNETAQNVNVSLSSLTYSEQSASNHTQKFSIVDVPISIDGQGGGFDTSKTYEITVYVIDTAGTTVLIKGTIKDGVFCLIHTVDSNGNYHTGINGIPDDSYALHVHGKFTADNYYPVGSVYLSYKSTSPASLFGGTWERLRDAYLYATNADSGDKGTRDGTGKITGQATGNTGSTAISVEQMPAHTHYMHTNGEHQHNMNMNSSTVAKGSNYARPRGWGEATEVGYTTSPAGGHKHSLDNTGGGQGHTHTLNSHTHTIANIEIYAWRRTA